MQALDEIIYDALRADADLMQAVGDRVVSTCFEVSPLEKDNTPTPCLIVTDDGFDNQPQTKDDTWEGCEDRIQASVEVDGNSPREVKNLISAVRKAVARHIHEMIDDGEPVPMLESVQRSQLAWDWTKPCYHATITYNCTIYNDGQ